MPLARHLTTAAVTFLAAVSVPRASTFAGQRYYVDIGVSASDDGSNWDQAFKYLQEALAAAGPGDEIWVAKGVYEPTDFGAGGRAASFVLRTGVTLYGGFASGDYDPAARDPRLKPAVLSGDLSGNDQSTCESDDDCVPGGPQACVDGLCRGDNSYHVVTADAVDGTAVLDGFYISGGQANGAGSDARGGGLLIVSGSPTIRNCIIEDNFAQGNGGGLATSAFDD